MKRIQRNHLSGFTLMELLVTVTIVGILASIAISLFDTYKGKANDSLAQSQIRSMATAFNASLADHDPTEMNDASSSGYVSFNRNGLSYLENTTLTIEQLLPGFVHQEDTLIYMSFYRSDSPQVIATHCRGSVVSGLYGEQYTKIFSLSGANSGNIISLPPEEQSAVTLHDGSGC